MLCLRLLHATVGDEWARPPMVEKKLPAVRPGVSFWSSLRFRVMVGVTVPLVLVLVVAAVVQYVHQRDLLLANLQDFAATVGDGVEATLTRAMLEQDRPAVLALADQLASNDAIRNLMILDSQGVVRVSTRPAEVGSTIRLTPTDTRRSFVFTAPDGTSVFRTVTPIRNQPACQSCHGSAARFNGTLITDLPYETVESHLRSDLVENLLLAGLAIVLVAAAIYVLLDRIVLEKVGRLRNSVAHYARGDYNARVDLSGRDELGELARSMNEMAEGLGEKAKLERQVAVSTEELSRRAARLAALYRISLESSRSLQLERVMRAGLEASLQATGMEAGEIHLAEGPGEPLNLCAQLGSPEAFLAEEQSLASGECLCGAVVAGGEICVRSELSGDPQVTRQACRRCGFRAIAAIPLKARGEAVGVLTLHCRDPRDFSSDDVALLSSIGEQLGIAIDNARLYGEMERRVQDLARQVQHLAVTEERVRLAREMHDGFAQALSLLNLQLQSLRAAGLDDRTTAAIGEMGQIVDETYQDVRQAIGDLRTTVDPNGRVVDSLVNYVESFALRYDLESRVELAPDVERAHCRPEVEIQVMRIVQEALANVRKHANARVVSVQVGLDDSRLRIAIHDDGSGFAAGEHTRLPGHYGLATMMERAAGIGGQCEVDSQPGSGTTVSLAVPLAP